MNRQTEELMKAYMSLSLQIRPNRIVSDLSSNEAMILSMLVEADGAPVAPSQVSTQCGMLKSLVNKYTESLEQKGLITRTRSEEDRRRICLLVTEKGKEAYSAIHRESMAYADSISGYLGPTKTEALTQLLKEALEAVRKQKKEK